MSLQCSRCLDDSNSRLGFSIGSDGVCRGCSGFEISKEMDSRLDSLVDRIKLQPSSRHHCLVLVTGVPEDFFVVKTLVANGLNPLLVYVNNYFSSNIAWTNLHRLITAFDVECRTVNPHIGIYKKLVRFSLRTVEDIYLPYKLLKFSSCVKIANQTGIKHIVTGDFQPMQTVGKFSPLLEVKNTLWSHFEHDLPQLSYSDLFNTGLDVSEEDLGLYLVQPEDLYSIEWDYLSNYLHWDQWRQDSDMKKYGALGQHEKNCFDGLYRSGSSVFFNIHDQLRLKKFGYMKVRDLLSREIRHRRITRANAGELYSYYLKNRNFNSDDFFKWLNIDSTGREWLRYHKVGKNVQSGNSNEINVRDFFSDYIPNDLLHTEKDFCTFEKGI